MPDGKGGGVWPSPEGSESPVASSVGQTMTKRGGWTAPFLPAPLPSHTHPTLHWPEEERGPRLHGADQPGPGSLWVCGVDVLRQGLKKGCAFIPTSSDVGSPQLPQRAQGGL